MSLEELFCQVDDFCQAFMPEWETTLVNEAIGQKPWQYQMSASEIMTIETLSIFIKVKLLVCGKNPFPNS